MIMKLCLIKIKPRDMKPVISSILITRVAIWIKSLSKKVECNMLINPKVGNLERITSIRIPEEAELMKMTLMRHPLIGRKLAEIIR